MPTYEYRCEACGHEMEEFQSITAKPLKKCPSCGKNKLQRLIGIGAGIIFKGSGFYETDYRSDSYKQAEKADKEQAKGSPSGSSTDKAGDTSGGGAASKPGNASGGTTAAASNGTSAGTSGGKGGKSGKKAK